MRLKFGVGLRGRIHVTEVNLQIYLPTSPIIMFNKLDQFCAQVSNTPDEASEAPFSNFRVGQTVVARIVAEANHSASKGKGYLWELSVKPEVLKGKANKSLKYFFDKNLLELIYFFELYFKAWSRFQP